jgi:uncharacterized protein
MIRPFPFETPISPEALIDRRAELQQLHVAAAERVHVRLSGPRRFGKTSILLAHAESLRGAGWRAVHVDLYGVTSLAEICARIATAYGRLRDSRLRAHLDALSSRLGVSLTTTGIGVSVGPRTAQQDSDATLVAAEELLDLPLRLHRRDGQPTLVVFDEFQDVLSAGAGLDGLLRSHVQYHGDAAVYVYAGSQPSLMRRLFSDRERPLYGQAEPLELGPLPVDEVHAELAERFEELGEEPGEALAPLVSTGAGHPQRTMLLAHLLHRELAARAAGATTLPGAGPSLEGIALAEAVIVLALEQTVEALQANWDGLSSGKKAVLAALADGASPTGSRTATRHGLSRAALQTALRDLAKQGQHLTRVGAGWSFVDPLFALWVKTRGHPPASG